MKRAAVVITGATLVAMLGLMAQTAAAQCCGDCNGDNEVTVNEIVTAVNRALTSCQDDGVCGAASVHGLERVTFSSTSNSEPQKKAFAKCPSGKQVIGGGAQVFIAGNAVGPIALKASFPSNVLDGWAATAEEMVPTDLNWFVNVFAICATVTP